MALVASASASGLYGITPQDGFEASAEETAFQQLFDSSDEEDFVDNNGELNIIDEEESLSAVMYAEDEVLTAEVALAGSGFLQVQGPSTSNSLEYCWQPSPREQEHNRRTQHLIEKLSDALLSENENGEFVELEISPAVFTGDFVQKASSFLLYLDNLDKSNGAFGSADSLVGPEASHHQKRVVRVGYYWKRGPLMTDEGWLMASTSSFSTNQNSLRVLRFPVKSASHPHLIRIWNAVKSAIREVGIEVDEATLMWPDTFDGTSGAVVQMSSSCSPGDEDEDEATTPLIVRRSPPIVGSPGLEIAAALEKARQRKGRSAISMDDSDSHFSDDESENVLHVMAERDVDIEAQCELLPSNDMKKNDDIPVPHAVSSSTVKGSFSAGSYLSTTVTYLHTRNGKLYFRVFIAALIVWFVDSTWLHMFTS